MAEMIGTRVRAGAAGVSLRLKGGRQEMEDLCSCGSVEVGQSNLVPVRHGTISLLRCWNDIYIIMV